MRRVLCPARRRRPGRRRGHRPDPGGRRGSGHGAPRERSTSRRPSSELAGRARAARRRCTRRPTQLLDGGTPRVRARGSRTLQGPSRRGQQVGVVVRPVPRRVPGLPAGRAPSAASEIAFVGLNASDKDARGASASWPSARCPFPSYTDPDEEIAQRAQGAVELPRSRSSSTRNGKTAFIHPGGYTSATQQLDADIDQLPRRMSARGPRRPADGPEDDRRRRARRPPRRRLRRRAARRRSTPSSDPFLPGPRGPDAARGLRGAPDGDAPDTPGWTRARGAEPLPGARRPTRRAAERDANPDLFTAQPAAGAHEVIVNAPEPVQLAGRARRAEQVALAVDDVARADARARATPPACT